MTLRPMLILAVATMFAVIGPIAGPCRADDAPATTPATAPASAPAKALTLIFDFASDPKGNAGTTLADSLRLRLARHAEFIVVDRITTHEIREEPVAFATDSAEVIDLVKESAQARLALYGTAQHRGDTWKVDLVILDFKDADKPAVEKLTFSAEGERAAGLVATKIVEAIRKHNQWRPPEYGDEDEPKELGTPLVLGDFEKFAPQWDRPDNVSTFLEAGPKGRGTVLRIRTDLLREPWLEYKRKLMFGQADPNDPPGIPRDTSDHNSVASLEGVHYRSEWIDAAAGQRYWLVADMKGKTKGMFFPKIYVKGYYDCSAQADSIPEQSLVERKMTAKQFAAMPADKRKELLAQDVKLHGDRYRRECFRWYLSCRNEADEWTHYAAPLPPRGGLGKKVRWLRVEIHAYWPPGEYRFDNVSLYKDPRQKTPQPEEAPRTPHGPKLD